MKYILCTLFILGYSKGYNMKHKNESGLNYLPEGLENVNFFDYH